MSSDKFLDDKRLKKLDRELESLISRIGVDRKTVAYYKIGKLAGDASSHYGKRDHSCILGVRICVRACPDSDCRRIFLLF